MLRGGRAVGGDAEGGRAVGETVRREGLKGGDAEGVEGLGRKQ